MCAFIHLNTLTQFLVTLTEESPTKLSSHLLPFLVELILVGREYQLPTYIRKHI